MPNNRNCGFFNSNEEGDRPYDAEDISQMMTGMVTGGVFPNVGDKFAVTASGTEITIGIGKAWWHGKWFENSAQFTIDDGASSENDRIDILVIEVNETEEVRNVDFKIIKGIPSSEPEEPEITNAGGVYQLPIARIIREAGDIEIATENLEYLPGTERSPWAETALDPNKCVYAYEDETEEIEFETIALGGSVTVDSSQISQARDNGWYQTSSIFIEFNKVFKEEPVVIANIKETYGPWSSDVDYADIRVRVMYSEINGFYIRVLSSKNIVSADVPININWIATGLLNE